MNDQVDTRPSAQIIYDAIVDLHNAEQVVTREVLRDVTGLKMTTVDEHVKNLANAERIRRVQNGVYVPMVTPPPARAISLTEVPGGLLKVEIGDDCFELWPREARVFGKLFSGHGNEYASIQAGHEMGILAVELAGKVKRLERELAAWKNRADPQPELFVIEMEGKSR